MDNNSIICFCICINSLGPIFINNYRNSCFPTHYSDKREEITKNIEKGLIFYFKPRLNDKGTKEYIGKESIKIIFVVQSLYRVLDIKRITPHEATERLIIKMDKHLSKSEGNIEYWYE